MQGLFGWSTDTWLLLDQLGILLGLVTAVVTLAGLALAILKRDELRRWLTRNRFPSVGGALPDGLRHEGIVFTVSRPETPIWVVETRRPTIVGLIATRESATAARAVEQAVARLNVRVLPLYFVENPDEPGESRRACLRLLEDLSVGDKPRLAVDITGGKVPMSLGAFMAAEEFGADTLYVSSQFDSDLKRPRMETARLVVISSVA